MISVLQRVSSASVNINGVTVGKIEKGLVILLGIEHRDSMEDVHWLAKKITGMRIFSDTDDRMNLSCQDIGGNYLVISQFTLHASTKKGNRPSFLDAARPDKAIPLYESFVKELKKVSGQNVQTGEFGADMQISLINDGPVTIIIDSQNKS
jgi:D-tyrosyl-tRNA(Tyr) deacylase